MARNFTRTNEGCGLQRWAHKAKPVFVAFYPRVGRWRGVFYVYEATAAVPAGRAPWTVSNRRIDAPRGAEGLSSLGAALSLAETTSWER